MLSTSSSDLVLASKFIEFVLNRGLLGDADFHVADVGVSGGLASRWSTFGDRLCAVGFDPLTSEVRRLAAAERRPKVRYEAAFVGWREYDQAFPVADREHIRARHIQPFIRSSAVRALHLQQRDYVREHFNAGAAVEYTDRHTTLDEYFATEVPPHFIKIDTDGSDYPVLRGAQGLLQRGVLGLEVEAQFHGPVHPHGNTLANIDTFLREQGFSLFDLAAYRYSRAALPAPFEYDLLAQTTSGQIGYGEAVYFRDLGHPDYERMFPFRATQENVLQLCCLFVLYGFIDCTAELLTEHPALQHLAERHELLDLLARSHGAASYDDYMKRFEADPTVLYPSRRSGATLAALPSGAVALEGRVGFAHLVMKPQWGGRLEHGAESVRLITSEIPWGYAAEIAVPATALAPAAKHFVRLRVQVAAGALGVGVLAGDGSRFLFEQRVAADDRVHEVFLQADTLAMGQRLILRNANTAGESSVATITGIQLYQIP